MAFGKIIKRESWLS